MLLNGGYNERSLTANYQWRLIRGEEILVVNKLSLPLLTISKEEKDEDKSREGVDIDIHLSLLQVSFYK